MRALVVVVVFAGSGLAHAQARLTPEGSAVRLLEERPSVPPMAGSVLLVSAGSVLGLAGLAASGFGVFIIATAGSSTYSGLVVAMGAGLLVPGLIVAVVGIALFVVGVSRLRQHLDADDGPLLAERVVPGGFDGLTTVGTF